MLTWVLSSIMLLSLLTVSPETEISAKAAPATGTKNACWISFLDIEALLQDKNENEFRARVSAMYDNVIK